MIAQGEVISYPAMCQEEGTSLQRGMNFRLPNGHTVVLMSVRKGAPYADRVEEDGKVLIYEGHNQPRSRDVPDTTGLDQPNRTPAGNLTENGKFAAAVASYKSGEGDPELVWVYEKIRDGIWVFNGVFELTDQWMEPSNGRQVFKFRLELTDRAVGQAITPPEDLTHSRLIPSAVKREVWARDKGRCVKCGSSDNLHFDHDLPYSRGGTSLRATNIRLLCARHNLEKAARIE